MLGKIFKKNNIEVVVLSADSEFVTIQDTTHKGRVGSIAKQSFQANYVEVVNETGDDMAVSNDEINTKEVKNSKGKI